MRRDLAGPGHLPLVESIGRAELWVALAAWLLVSGAMGWHVLDTVVLSPRGRLAARRLISAWRR